MFLIVKIETLLCVSILKKFCQFLIVFLNKASLKIIAQGRVGSDIEQKLHLPGWVGVGGWMDGCGRMDGWV